MGVGWVGVSVGMCVWEGRVSSQNLKKIVQSKSFNSNVPSEPDE